MAARHEEGWYEEKHVSAYFLACKGLSNDDVWVARFTVFKEIRPGAAFESGDFAKEALGGLPWNGSWGPQTITKTSTGQPTPGEKTFTHEARSRTLETSQPKR